MRASKILVMVSHGGPCSKRVRLLAVYAELVVRQYHENHEKRLEHRTCKFLCKIAWRRNTACTTESWTATLKKLPWLGVKTPMKMQCMQQSSHDFPSPGPAACWSRAPWADLGATRWGALRGLWWPCHRRGLSHLWKMKSWADKKCGSQIAKQAKLSWAWQWLRVLHKTHVRCSSWPWRSGRGYMAVGRQ